MKIYIETNMTEMPKGCTWCKRKVCWERNERVDFVSKISNNEKFEQYINTINNDRPDWCPLRTETEIADKAKEKEDGKRNVKM